MRAETVSPLTLSEIRPRRLLYYAGRDAVQWVDRRRAIARTAFRSNLRSARFGFGSRRSALETGTNPGWQFRRCGIHLIDSAQINLSLPRLIRCSDMQFLHGKSRKIACALCGAVAYCCGAVAPCAIAALLGRFLPRLGPLAIASGPFFLENAGRTARGRGRTRRARHAPDSSDQKFEEILFTEASFKALGCNFRNRNLQPPD
jgi:hypothetical protein